MCKQVLWYRACCTRVYKQVLWACYTRVRCTAPTKSMAWLCTHTLPHPPPLPPVSQDVSRMACEPSGMGGNREGAELVKVLERHLKDARAIDTEALCIVAGERVRPSTLRHVVVLRASGFFVAVVAPCCCCVLHAACVLLHTPHLIDWFLCCRYGPYDVMYMCWTTVAMLWTQPPLPPWLPSCTSDVLT